MLIDHVIGVFRGNSRRGAGWSLAALLLVQVSWLAASGGHPDTSSIAYRNTAPRVGFVGSEVCGGCHIAIYETYLKTDMGRSMSLPIGTDEVAKISSRIAVHDANLNRYFETFRQGPDIFQSEYELAADGNEIFRNTQKVTYVIGSGANGVGYIVRQGSYLLEAPLSYYAKTKSWALSPGYELGDYGFSRTIPAGCIVCHSGLPEPAPGEYGRYNDPPFRELAIGCERCHGPGELHVQERTQGAAITGSIDTAIVNPSKLSGWLADNICMSCHQDGDTRVLQPGKNYSDFRPGTPLDDTVAIFALPLTPQSPPASPLLEHYSLMKLSKCFTSSGGRLSCLTCHDPHVQPRIGAAAYYRQRCMKCHTEESCTLPLRVRSGKLPQDDCAGCHMPRRSLTVISHSVLTDHRIVARQSEPYPEAAFHQTTPGLRDLIHVNAIPGRKDEVSPLTLLRAYGDLAGSYPEYRAHFQALVNQLGEDEPNDPLVLSALGLKSLNEGTSAGKEAAALYWSRAIQLGSSSAADYENLGSLLAELGRTNEAITIFELGIKLDPYDERLYKHLAQLEITAHRYSQALEVMKKDLEFFPEDDFMRSLVKMAEQGGPMSTGQSEKK
jgi:hypothetical protein